MQYQQQQPAKIPPREEITYCSVDRVGGQAFLVLCTTARWQVFRLDKFTATRESLTPVQIVVEGTALLSNVSMVRLFCLDGHLKKNGGVAALGGFFVSEKCDEVDYTQPFPYATSTSVASTDSSEELAVFSFPEERILKRLPPTPSGVVDLQIQRTTAAVLCESHEILLVDLKTYSITQRITSLSSLAMALGPRWIAYPELSPSVFDDDSDSEDGDEIVPEALVHNGSRQLLPSTSHSQTRASSRSSSSTPSSSYNAIDVAQNVASGIYFLSKTIAPYLSTSPSISTTSANANGNSMPTEQFPQNQQNQQPTNFATNANTNNGWVTIQDFHTNKVVTSFQCHSTALVHLAFDSSGGLLATSSTKGQNVHVYRLLPALQQAANTTHKRPSRHQLLYKLQRGITHASIADMAFSQDTKWLSVTSCHGTSHLYAIHPDGAPMSVHTHATKSHHNDHDDPSGSSSSMGHRDVRDFCASLRAVEPKTLTRVLKIHHSLLAPPVASTTPSVSRSYGSSNGALSASSVYYNGSSSPPSTLVGTALDASQALFSQLAQSTGLNGILDFGELHDGSSSRGRRPRRMSCLFASDGLKMVICCDTLLKLYDLSVHTPSVSSSASSGVSKTRPSPFGFDATVTELKSWDMGAAAAAGDAAGGGRFRTESLALVVTPTTTTTTTGDDDGSKATHTSHKNTSEMRTFAQRGLPLWAHPKVVFRVLESGNPDGVVLQVKRKGPSTTSIQYEYGYGGDGVLLQDTRGHGDSMDDDGGEQQLFVMEMDSYFGMGGSPVFTAGQSQPQSQSEPPRLDLAESMNMAISTSLHKSSATASQVGVSPQAPSEPDVDVGGKKTAKKRSSKKNHTNKNDTKSMSTNKTSLLSPPVDDDRCSSSYSSSNSPLSVSSSLSTSESISPTILQFTLQDLYFAVEEPAEEAH